MQCRCGAAVVTPLPIVVLPSMICHDDVRHSLLTMKGLACHCDAWLCHGISPPTLEGGTVVNAFVEAAVAKESKIV